jgi:hypothetical protein
MKKLIYTFITALLTAAWSIAGANAYQSGYLGLPGDNLNLYAVMKLFQESETLESFERSLNDPNSMINNLDLNGDNMIDYISVHDYVDGNVHNIVLRANLNRNVSQDVAVFVVQQFNNGSVHIQLIGDEALYGKNYIIEPIVDEYYAETPNPGYLGTPTVRTNVTVVRTTPYQIAAWPVVRFIYAPSYLVWRSAWYWGYYPTYWKPWRPYYWHYYYGYHSHLNTFYHTHFHYTVTPRYARYTDFYYTNVRVYSPTVIVRVNEGKYNYTYSRPEQKAEGEALYARRNPVETTVARESTAVSASGRRNTSTGVTERAATTNAAETRTSATLRSAAAGAPATQSTEAARRSTSTSATDRRTSTTPVTGQTREATQATPANRAVQPANKREVNTATKSAQTPATQPRTTTQQSPATPQRQVTQQRAATQPAPATQQRTVTQPRQTAKPAQTTAPRQSTGTVTTGSRATTQRSTTVQSRTTKSTTAPAGSSATRSTTSSSSRR